MDHGDIYFVELSWVRGIPDQTPRSQNPALYSNICSHKAISGIASRHGISPAPHEIQTLRTHSRSVRFENHAPSKLPLQSLN